MRSTPRMRRTRPNCCGWPTSACMPPSGCRWSIRGQGRHRLRLRRRSRPSARLQPGKRRGIGFAGEVFQECRGEDWFGRSDAAEERDRRAELEIVRVAEDVADGAVGALVYKVRTLAQARTERGMRKVGFGLRAAGDGEVLRHVAGAEAGNLREDEPHPVAALASCAKLDEHLREDAGLGIDEALEVVRIGCRSCHGAISFAAILDRGDIGIDEDMAFLAILARAFSPPVCGWQLTWGVAPGLDSARLQRDFIRQLLSSGPYVDTAQTELWCGWQPRRRRDARRR